MPVVNHSYNQTLSLLQATPGGAATLTTIAEVDWSGSGPISFTNPIGQIPDGSGGTFASWYTTTGSTLVNHISHITSAGVIDSTPSFQNPILPDGMVLGESATLFATDGLSVSSFTPSLAVNWTYNAPPQTVSSRAADHNNANSSSTTVEFVDPVLDLTVDVVTITALLSRRYSVDLSSFRKCTRQTRGPSGEWPTALPGGHLLWLRYISESRVFRLRACGRRNQTRGTLK